jgi:putative protease
MSSAALESAAPSNQSATTGGVRRPELLAPAGDWECARAAVENGADAIYFGLEKFNARMRAHNFTEADLPRLMEFLHRRGVRGYVAFNTLIFQNELADAEQCLRSMIAAGVDAAIVQDVGICRMIRRLSPDFPIHASTQMTITSAAGVEFARRLGCNLVVLARENSLKDIERIHSELRVQSSGSGASAAEEGRRNLELPLEVFVHGALCVAYSGQCLTSEALGGRSANRGECAQACRMPYELICDGQAVPLGDRRYLLSPQDLAGIDVLPELVRVGVASLKIEGRLKTPEYVANITRIYRQALDSIATSRLPAAEANATLPGAVLRDSRYNLEMAFSRGLYSGWFRGINNRELVHARFGKKRGVYLGQVTRVQGERIFVTLEGPLKAGDGVVFDAGHPEQEEQGGRVYEIREQRPDGRGASSAPSIKREVSLSFGRGDLDCHQVRPGDRLWKTSDPELDRRLRQSFAGDQPRFQRPLSFEVHGRTGLPLTVIARDDFGHMVRLDSIVPLTVAHRQPLSTGRLREQLGRLGGTPFKLGELRNLLAGAVMVPISELNRLRRELVLELEGLRAKPKGWTLKSSGLETVTSEVRSSRSKPALEMRNPELIVLVRSLSQLEAALRCGISTLYCDFDDPRKYRDAVRLVRQETTSGASPGNQCTGMRRPCVFVAPPRISKPGEDWILKQVRACEADGYLLRNYDHLTFFSDCRGIGDFSLNVANTLTAEHFKNEFGLERMTLSYDLNATQLEAMLQAAPAEWFEVTIHQHMPMFHMEHCVFCAFLSKGTDYTNCGRPCDKHHVQLRDRTGAEHILRADVGCRNTLFNAAAQTGAEYVERLLAHGLRYFRIEFVSETPHQITPIITKYLHLLRGEITGLQVWRELKLVNQLGVTRGALEER